MGIPCKAAQCDICGDWLDRFSSPEHFVSDSVIPDLRLIHLKIIISVMLILWRFAFCNAQYLIPNFN